MILVEDVLQDLSVQRALLEFAEIKEGAGRGGSGPLRQGGVRIVGRREEGSKYASWLEKS